MIFALFGIKNTYLDKPLSTIMFENLDNLAWIIGCVLAGFFADYLLLSRNRKYLGG